MIAIIINTSGNVGKSNLSRGLYQFLNDEKAIIELETHNSSSVGFKGLNVIKFEGSNTRDMFTSMMTYDNVIVDCGASVVDSFLNEIIKTPEVLGMVDYYIIPTVSDTKQSNDTLKTLTILNSLGVDPNIVKVVFNRVKSDIQSEFTPIIKVMQKLNIEVDPQLAIKNYEVLENLERMKLLTSDLIEVETDYRTLAREKAKEGDMKASKEASDKLFTQMLAKSYHQNLQQVFTAISES